MAAANRMDAPNSMAPPTFSAPNPDPTARTIEQSNQNISALKELMEARLEGVEKLATRLQALIDARPAAAAIEIGHLQRLVEQKFLGVDQQFTGRDVALAAALLAQKTSVEEQNKSNALAVSKSDAAVTKQIDAIGAQIGATSGALTDKIDDLRARVQAIEGHSKGSNDSFAWVFAVIGGLAAVGAVIVAVLK